MITAWPWGGGFPAHANFEKLTANTTGTHVYFGAKIIETHSCEMSSKAGAKHIL